MGKIIRDINAIIKLSKKVLAALEEGNVRRARVCLERIVAFDLDELRRLQREGEDKSVIDACSVVLRDTKQALQDLNSFRTFSEAKSLVTQIVNVEAYEKQIMEAEEYIKRKIIDIIRPGTFIRLFDSRDFEHVWIKGIQNNGSAVMLGPVTVGAYIGENVTIQDVLDGRTYIFGFRYGKRPEKDSISPEGRLIAHEMTQDYYSKKILDGISRDYGPFLRTNREKAMLRLLMIKYKDLNPNQPLPEMNDRIFLSRILSSYPVPISSDDFYISSSDESVRWDLGLIINPSFTRKPDVPEFQQANEHYIIPGNPRDQIIGIYLKRSAELQLIKGSMFRLTRNNPKDRVPIYYANGELAWPKL